MRADAGVPILRAAAGSTTASSNAMEVEMNKSMIAMAAAATVAAGALADVVTDWNARAVETLVAAGTPATLASRNMAAVQLAVYEASNAAVPTAAPYRLRLSAPPGASVDAAVAAAAHAVLVRLYPDRRAVLDAALETSLQPLPDAPARQAGRSVGEQAAAAILELRKADGIEPRATQALRTGLGLWAPAPNVAALAPHWGGVTPWALNSASQFRPEAPPAIDSERQQRDYDEVLALGGKSSTRRSAEQTEVARLWITPGVPTWNPIARQLAAAPGRTPAQNARLFALLAIATADAIVACWDAKYTYSGWRPMSAIRAGAVPGRAADPAWEPAVPTPPFPGYVSGHACFGGAAQVVLESEFGSGEVPELTLSTTTAPGLTRRYSRIASIVEEASNARIWGGIHWRTDQTAGEHLGRKVGRFVLDTQLRPLP
jgi:hypothetical protein